MIQTGNRVLKVKIKDRNHPSELRKTVNNVKAELCEIQPSTSCFCDNVLQNLPILCLNVERCHPQGSILQSYTKKVTVKPLYVYTIATLSKVLLCRFLLSSCTCAVPDRPFMMKLT